MHRHFRHVLAGVVLIGGLAGCAASTVNTIELRNDQALFVAERTFKGLSVSLNEALDLGLLKGPAAASARDKYEKAHEFLIAAEIAHDAGDQILEGVKAAAAIKASAGLSPDLPLVSPPAPASATAPPL